MIFRDFSQTEEVIESDLRLGDVMILLATDTHTIHHFEVYSGPLDFVARIAKFTDGRGCSLERGHYYKIVKRS